MRRKYFLRSFALLAASIFTPAALAFGWGDRDPLLFDLAQYEFTCSQLDAEQSCPVALETEIDLHEGSRFVIHYVNVTILTHGDEAKPREFYWGIGWGTYGTNFSATATKRDYLGTQAFVSSEKVLLVVDELGFGIPFVTCLADRPNETGEAFGCNFVVTGRFVKKP